VPNVIVDDSSECRPSGASVRLRTVSTMCRAIAARHDEA
jgi:hypothetical protein